MSDVKKPRDLQTVINISGVNPIKLGLDHGLPALRGGREKQKNRVLLKMK